MCLTIWRFEAPSTLEASKSSDGIANRSFKTISVTMTA